MSSTSGVPVDDEISESGASDEDVSTAVAPSPVPFTELRGPSVDSMEAGEVEEDTSSWGCEGAVVVEFSGDTLSSVESSVSS